MTQRIYERITTGHPHTSVRDYEAKRYFVYTLADEAGAPLYVGRSCDVASRIKAHIADAAHSPYGPRDSAFKASWVFDIRSVTMNGPYTWDGAVAEERRQIKSKLPRGNRTGMPRAHQLAVIWVRRGACRSQGGRPMTPDPCPRCGGNRWVTASDGLGAVASVAAACVSCGYLTASVVDLTSVTPPDEIAP
jgi:predicted GIY-YIG superfamily endonuclease